MTGTLEISEAKRQSSPQTETSELNTIRGIIKPAVRATISSEIQARIRHLPFKDGQRFRKGQILVLFDCVKYKAQLHAARAEYEAKLKTLENNLELSKLNAIGELEVDISKIDVKKAIASIYLARINIKHCRIHAPFSGRVVKVLVNRYESVNPYDELLSILDDRHFEIELILPSTALRWIKKGMSFQFTVDETNETFNARVTELGASIAPVSQTMRLTGTFKNPESSVLSGMSGSAHFPDNPQNLTKTRSVEPTTKSHRLTRRSKRTQSLSTIRK
ncbi:efflux RND transporter periplasmic adaptor subunit [Nitrospira sp. M1]